MEVSYIIKHTYPILPSNPTPSTYLPKRNEAYVKDMYVVYDSYINNHSKTGNKMTVSQVNE